MNYDEVVAAMFVAPSDGTPVPGVVRDARPARRLRDAVEPLAMHAVWSRTTNERLARLGLDFLAAYITGRAASLGRPSGAVVAAAFAWFEPGLIGGVWDTSAAAIDLGFLLDERDAATAASLAEVLAGEEVAPVADALADALAGADGMGRPLFSGLRARGRPRDPFQRLWWACDLVREHRGDSHVAAAAAAAVGPVEMNILTELWLGMPLLSYTATRGWPPAVMAGALERVERCGWVRDGELSAEGHRVRAAIEETTDAQERHIVDQLGAGLPGLCDTLESWAQRCIDRGAFPPDPRKRAAG